MKARDIFYCVMMGFTMALGVILSILAESDRLAVLGAMLLLPIYFGAKLFWAMNEETNDGEEKVLRLRSRTRKPPRGDV